MTRKKWTDAEIRFLKENVGRMKIETIAQKLHRSEGSIVSKMKRLGIAYTKNQTGHLSTHQLAELLSVDRNTIIGWMKRHGLKYTKKVTRTTKSFYFIDPMEFWKWADRNREKIDFSKIECNAIAPEPEWVRHERSKQKEEHYKVWSVKEERVLKMMVLSGYSYTEVAQRLSRTKTSVQRKFQRMTRRG
ncbi:DNA-binding protein [Heyndrickxia camelliae]|uniref:DNA-binding protein n=1 Tax=Heyndrickxia camelliae TaxID=1707093 RepID=A0A2N3LPF2_9BACI|nr:DNA-binding protein [Heyndrickxia camelliae]PKR86434.1 DNA-binding protein [Heyndrickxia camelliae]